MALRAALALLLAGAAACCAAEPERPLARLVPEMERIPELDNSKFNAGEPYAEALAQLQKKWPARAEAVAKQLTPEAVRGLSRWAKKQMEGYTSVAPLDKLAFQVAGAIEQGPGQKPRVVCEAVIQTLPSHSPIVTRWLKVYAVWDQDAGRIADVIVTIRGEALE